MAPGLSLRSYNLAEEEEVEGDARGGEGAGADAVRSLGWREVVVDARAIAVDNPRVPSLLHLHRTAAAEPRGPCAFRVLRPCDIIDHAGGRERWLSRRATSFLVDTQPRTARGERTTQPARLPSAFGEQFRLQHQQALAQLRLRPAKDAISGAQAQLLEISQRRGDSHLPSQLSQRARAPVSCLHVPSVQLQRLCGALARPVPQPKAQSAFGAVG